VSALPRVSSWFSWHDYLIRPGSRLLDVACGEGRHSVAAAALGASVTALDRDEARIATGQDYAAARGLAIDWHIVDLEQEWPPLGAFDAVLVFNYLDRAGMPRLRDFLAPGGVLIMETFLESQRALGWGPQAPEHLLRPGELAQLTAPLETVHGREVTEPADSGRSRAVASIVAERRPT